MPKSEVPGEESSPTQPFPTKPPPFARQVFKVEDVNPFIPERTGAAASSRFARRPTRGCSRRPATALSHSVSRRVGRRQLGKHRRRTRRRGCSSCAASRCRAIAGWRSDVPRPPTLPQGAQERRGYTDYTQLCCRVSRPRRDADAIAGGARPGAIPRAGAPGSGSDAGVLR